MDMFLADYGYSALFAASFLASTLLPVGSEWLLVSMLLKSYDPVAVVAVATIGNYLGACVTYGAGFYGGPFLVRKVLRVSEESEKRAEDTYIKYGSWSLFFSWIPIIGDPLCLIAGIMRIGLGRFSFFVATGKLIRYFIVAWITLKAHSA